MDQEDLCEHLHVRHIFDSKKTGREHRPEKPYKKWKRRWVVLSGNISPSKCCLNYCKKENDWLSKNQCEITRCQLTNFSVQKFTGRGEHDNHLVISLRTYSICLSFESITKMEQWYRTLERVLECYQVIVKCQEHLDLEGDHVIQFSSPGQLKVWGMDGQLQWEWLLQDVRRVYYHQSSDQLEIEVGRRTTTGEGIFMFSGQLVFRLFLAVKEAMKASREPHPQRDTPPHTRPPSQHSPTPTEQLYGSISDSSVAGISLGCLSIVSAPETVRRRPTTSSKGPASTSSLETTPRRQPLTAGRNPSQSKTALNPPLPQAHAGDYMQLRYLATENPASEYVEICRDPAATPTVWPQEGSAIHENTDEGEYIHPHGFFANSVHPLRIEEESITTSMSLDSDDSS